MDVINKTQYWDERRGHIYSAKGGWVIGKGIASHGYSLLDDLVGGKSFFQVMVLNATGKMLPENFTRWLEATFICLSWPDSRIWCNQMGSYGGETKTSPVAAICAGVLASDSSLYGPGTVISATRFIVAALDYVRQGGVVDEYIETMAKTRLGLVTPGFARPMAKGDERVERMRQVAQELGFVDGPHMRTARAIEKYLLTQYDESMNLAGYIMAFLSDQGFSEQENYRIYSMCVNSGVHAAYSEAYDNVPDSYLPLRCEDIVYTGIPERVLL
ncbi:MAG: hypothetical protein WCY88_15405 [Spongiibacteraceae bacterium]